ncbi:hypothetical protein [Streptomyces sp. NPDC001914]|uniref:hypothetical protein n=1 Tax=Streptomyces sp. NPDC001914 TaxID=3364623 RepID=UPI0036A2B9A5
MAGARGAGIVLVTDATGAGKTATAPEAVRILNDVWGSRGLRSPLPTTATADAAYDALCGYLHARRTTPGVLTLVHNRSWLNAAYSDEMLAPVTSPPALATTLTPMKTASGRPSTVRRAGPGGGSSRTAGYAAGTAHCWSSSPSPPSTRH